MKGTKKPRVGDLLVREGLISPEQLEQALLVQKSQRSYKPLGETCVELEFLSRAGLNRFLNTHKMRMELGDLLINLGLITDEQLHEALDYQKSAGGKIGDILLKRGFITNTALLNALTIQMGVPNVVPDLNLIDKTLLEGISEEFLVKHEIMPAFKEGDVLTVIMSNPLDDRTVGELGRVFKCRIEPAVALPEDIRNAIRQHYSGGGGRVSPAKKKDLIIGDKDFAKEKKDSIVGILDYLITSAVTEGASDIHLEPKEKCLRVRYRVDGLLRHKTDLPISLAPSLVSRIKALCDMDIAEKRRHQDGRIKATIMDREIDLRISVYASAFGENLVIRILQRLSRLIDLDSMDISPANLGSIRQMLDQPSGIILVTGPTGSGKTTTLYAALNHLNNGERAIITVEDPIEYTIDGVVQGQLDHRLGLNYVDFLKSMMRQDPDVIMVGEIRDRTAAEAVVQAALTGHKVLTTFHTDDTTGALLRLMDMGIDTFLISSTVISIVAQRLVRVLCPQCRKAYEPDELLLPSFGVSSAGIDKFRFYQPAGCSACSYTGFKGRTAVHEVLVVNDAIRDAILARKSSGKIRLAARRHAKLLSMREDGFYKATMGVTSLEEIMRVVFYNESDEISLRSPEEIVALSEKATDPVRRQVPTARRSEKPIPRETGSSAPVVHLDDSAIDGEAYRIRLDVTGIEIETDRIADLFHAYQEIMDRVGNAVAPDLLGDFIDFIIYTVKRVELSLQSEYVEFSIRVKEGKVKILLETLVPRSVPAPFIRTTRETGLRLINFLDPPSGMAKALASEKEYGKTGGRGSLIELMRLRETRRDEDGEAGLGQAALPGICGLDQGRRFGAAVPGSSGLYKKYTEELELGKLLNR